MSDIPDQQPQKTPQPDESQAEKHVAELMGPAQDIYTGSTPEAAEPAVQSVSTETKNKEATTAKTPPMPAGEPSSEGEDDTLEAIQSAMAKEAEETQSLPEIHKPNHSVPHGAVVMKSTWQERLKEAFFKWWDNPVKRYVTLGIIAVVIGVAVAVPLVRTWTLNLVGVRTSVSVTALDGTTFMPLENVVLQVGEAQTKTNQEGKAKLHGVKLGSQTVSVHKSGFAEVKRKINFSMRTVDLGELELKAVGAQYRLTFTDFLSGKPVSGAYVSSGEASAKSDQKGLAVITLPPSGGEESTLTIEKEGYRTETITTSETAALEVGLVAAQPEVFIEKNDGVYNVYRIDLDGKNRRMLLAGTGLETPDITLSVDPAGKRAALVATRDNKKNSDGFLLRALTLIDTETGESSTIEHAEEVKIVGWHGATLVYKQTVAGASAANPNRQKIITYDYAASKRYQVAAANDFSTEMLYGKSLYYLVTSTDTTGGGLFRANLDGSDKKTIYKGEAWSFVRPEYKTLWVQSPSKWHTHTLGSNTVSQAPSSTPAGMHVYLDSPDGKLSVWRDSEVTANFFSVYDVASGKEKQIIASAPVKGAFRWVGNCSIIYQTVKSGTTTDWVVSLDGGKPRELMNTLALTD